MTDAAVLRRRADRITADAIKMLEGIPPGQPVMSRRHRNLLDRHSDKMRAAAELYDQANAIDLASGGQREG